MKKFSLILLAVLLFAACEKDNENQYTLKRLASIEEYSADGKTARVSSYAYNDSGYVISTTLLNGVPSEKTVYQTFGHKVDFKHYSTPDGSTVTLTSYGSYIYETIQL